MHIISHLKTRAARASYRVKNSGFQEMMWSILIACARVKA